MEGMWLIPLGITLLVFWFVWVGLISNKSSGLIMKLPEESARRAIELKRYKKRQKLDVDEGDDDHYIS